MTARIVGDLTTCACCGRHLAGSAVELVEVLASGRAVALTLATPEPGPYGVTQRAFCGREHVLAWLQHPSSEPQQRIASQRPVYTRPRLAIVPRQAGPDDLVERELLVLRAAARGLSVDGTAREVHLSPDTVKTYRRRAFRKLGVGTIGEAIAVATRRGLLS